MKKQKINKFIKKYTLSGLIESVKWKSKNQTLKTSFISGDKSLLGNVTMKEFNHDNIEIGLYNTTILKNMLTVLSEVIDFSIIDINDKPVSIKFKDESISMNYMLSDLSVIPNVPNLKTLPDFDIEIKLDELFTNKFIKAKSALSVDEFTFISKNGTHQIILGYATINTHRVTIEVDGETKGDVAPISFSASYFKEILVANKDAKTAVLKISTEGLLHIHFANDEFETEYYITQTLGA